MKREDCWMTFTEALVQFIDNRDLTYSAPPGSARLLLATDRVKEAEAHLEALTGNES